ncbi:hypothetical protein D9619_009205 [Psilocybe cf. subviscida]|uniref:Uncharacterized protein n=1 Tax=Psilocybe cf. subviscida TaxID=2480587 RepID=A0A8H5BUW2_9AGAR|nr:hypothetical protein D9619_009205 [Psilocybe cf. subviscida]
MAVKELVFPIQSIFLDDQYQPEKDIYVFVTGEFDRIKQSHHLAYTLTEDWPSQEDTEFIARKSSGQFIFAATVMRYIANSSANPNLSLERVKGIVPAATNSPFANLDAIYTYIFSQADNREAVMDVLSMKLLNDSMNPRYSTIMPLLGILCINNPSYTQESLGSCMADLTAILQFNGKTVVFFHASLPDFLRDKSRALEYHIDLGSFGAKLLPAIWTKGSTTSTLIGIKVLDTLKMPTPEITMALRTILPVQAFTSGQWESYIDFNSVFHSIHRLYYPHDIKTYKKIVLFVSNDDNTYGTRKCIAVKLALANDAMAPSLHYFGVTDLTDHALARNNLTMYRGDLEDTYRSSK